MTVGLVTALTAFAAGCGDELDHGTVTGKKYEPERTYTQFFPIQTGQSCTRSGNSTICTPIYSQFPYTVHDGEDYILELRDENKKGKAYVDEATWRHIEVGSYFGKDDSPEAAFKDPNNSKERK